MIDFARWGVVAHKDDTGFGRMARDIRKVFGLGRHIVIPSERLKDAALNGVDELELATDASEEETAAALEGLQGIIFFERLNWSKHLISTARKMGVWVTCVPMWEWFRGEDRGWENVDLIICPHGFAEGVVRDYGWKQTVTLPWPIDLELLPARAISGPARLFVHNAGLVDRDDRKGTRDTIEAFMNVNRRDVKLVVRAQKETELPAHGERVEVRFGNLANVRDLYAEGDVAVQPSKMEGVGFMILEPVCSGLPVITVDYPPMSDWVRDAELRCRARWFNRKAYATNWVKHAHLRLPDLHDLARRIEWCAENDLRKFSETNRRWALATFEGGRLRDLWSKTLAQHLKTAAPA